MSPGLGDRQSSTESFSSEGLQGSAWWPAGSYLPFKEGSGKEALTLQSGLRQEDQPQSPMGGPLETQTTLRSSVLPTWTC